MAACPPARLTPRLAPRVVLALGLAALAAPAVAQAGRVPARPPSGYADEWVVQRTRANAQACIDLSDIAGAEVMDQRTVDVVLKGGRRWRLGLQRDCPQLTFYGGFYHEAASGRICAGRDRILGRAGGSCRVVSVAPLTRRR